MTLATKDSGGKSNGTNSYIEFVVWRFFPTGARRIGGKEECDYAMAFVLW